MKKPSRILRGIFALAIVLIVDVVGATDSVPIQFKDGDVISAGVMNELLQRLNQVQLGFESVDDLNGIWQCTVYDTGAPFGTDTCTPDGALVNSKTGNLTFNSSNKTWSWAGAGSLNDCGTGLGSTGSYDVKAGILLTNIGVYQTSRTSPNEFIWFVTNSFPPSGFNYCTKITTPPAPVDLLTATVTGTTVGLTWVDQSNNETGFRVERKTSASGTWASIATPASGATSYSDTGRTSGTYFYRVFSVNTNGDSISSSEVQAVVQ